MFGIGKSFCFTLCWHSWPQYLARLHPAQCLNLRSTSSSSPSPSPSSSLSWLSWLSSTQPKPENPKKKTTRARFRGRPPTMPTSLFSGLSRGSDLFNRCLLHLGEILHHQARGNIYEAHRPPIPEKIFTWLYYTVQYRIRGCRRRGAETSWSENNFGPKMMRWIEEENDKNSIIEKGGRFDTEEEKGGKQILWMINTGGVEGHFAIVKQVEAISQ